MEMDVKRRELTKDEKAAADNLKRIWEQKRKELGFKNQEQLGEVTGLGTQSVISQYMRGHIPLGTDAIIRFAKALKVSPSEINSKVIVQIQNISGGSKVKSSKIDANKLSATLYILLKNYGEEIFDLPIDKLSEAISQEYNDLP
jgi:transcriptional regulator with XRE-family HTH domain